MKLRYLPRPVYYDKIKPFIGKQIIKVLTGQRRIGKSYVLYQTADLIQSGNPDANIIYINCEQEKFHHLKRHTDLLEYLHDKIAENKLNYLFIDEVQEIDSFQLALRSLLSENNCDLYCTGSNARMLSGELATFLAGRYIEIPIHSLNFKEFLFFHKLDPDFASVMSFLTFGGMPYLMNIGLKDDLPFEYLRNVYSSILLKDVVARESIRNVSFLENLVRYLADNVGSLFSAANISKFLKSQQLAVSPQLTLNYLKALTNAYIIHKVQRTEIGGLKIFEIGEKYYFEDLGLRNSIQGFESKKDIHKLLENVVYLHLLQLGYRVNVGKLVQDEIDFVAERNGIKIYIQVSVQFTDPQTEQREFGNLIKIQDNYLKYVVTLNDPMIGHNYKGIEQINLLDFLLRDI